MTTVSLWLGHINRQWVVPLMSKENTFLHQVSRSSYICICVKLWFAERRSISLSVIIPVGMWNVKCRMILYALFENEDLIPLKITNKEISQPLCTFCTDLHSQIRSKILQRKKNIISLQSYCANCMCHFHYIVTTRSWLPCSPWKSTLHSALLNWYNSICGNCYNLTGQLYLNTL